MVSSISKQTAFRFIVVTSALTVATPSASACTRIPYRDSASEIAEAAAVFKGRVLEIEKSGSVTGLTPNGTRKTKLQILEIKKGVLGDQITIEYVQEPSTACGMNLNLADVVWIKMLSGKDGNYSGADPLAHKPN